MGSNLLPSESLILKSPLDQRLFPREFSLPLFYFYQHDTDRTSILVFHLRVPIKHNKVNRVPDEPGTAEAKGNSGKSGAICSEILPFSVERERLTEPSGYRLCIRVSSVRDRFVPALQLR